MKRAGDVVGMPDWQLDLMIQNERDRVWERLNIRPVYNYGKAADGLEKAIESLTNAMDAVGDAYCEAEDTPDGKIIFDAYDQLDNIRDDLKRILKEVKG